MTFPNISAKVAGVIERYNTFDVMSRVGRKHEIPDGLVATS